MNSFERFNEEKLPAKNIFTKDGKIGGDNKISDDHISVKDYLTCEKIWGKFEMKNMGDYHDHYLKKDILQLTDVFENFIDTCFKYYGLDPCHYFSSPGLSWDAMLKMTGVKLDKIYNIDKYLFIEKGLRGGISYIGKRYAKANNKYMNDYDPKKQSTFISYLDMNNLDETNKKFIGKMKDEFGGVIVVEFVGLKSKMYSVKKIDGKDYNTAKGVSIATEFDKFKDVLFMNKLLDTK